MAKQILLKHKSSGVMKNGYYGFSWTTLFFGGFPALFRGDFLTFLGMFAILVIVGFWSFGIGSLIAMFTWAFFYNGYYTRKLLERGYEFADTPHSNSQAASVLGVQIPSDATNRTETTQVQRTTTPTPTVKQSNFSPFKNEEKTLSNDAYRIYLVKKYPLEFNEVLKKYIFNNKLFETVEEALLEVHLEDQKNESLAQQNKRVSIYYSDKDEAISFLELNGIKVITQENRKFTVTDKSSTQYFYTESDFLQYANKKAVEFQMATSK